MTTISRALAAGLFALALTAAAPSMAQDVRSLAPGAAPAPATLDALKPLAGEWAGQGATVGFSAPTAGEVVGHVLLYTDKGPIMQEFWLIRPDGASLTVRQKHFSPDLNALEDKAQWIEHPLVAVEPGHLYFNDMTFVTTSDTLDLWGRLPGRNGGPPTILHYTMHRVR